jgi:predicted AAA+ superfamily ATPase
MLFLSGPRQVGKTTLAQQASLAREKSSYLTWDSVEHRRLILAGQESVANRAQLDHLASSRTLLVFDELHKYKGWKDFLKGFFDTRSDRADILVTGSARLDVFRSSGDSLTGRYLTYRVHPLSVAELVDPRLGDALLRPPSPLPESALENLERFSGFPEPFVLQEDRFYRQWRQTRSRQLLQEELRDFSRIHEIALVETLAELLRHRAGQLTTAAALSRDLRVSQDTVRRWLLALSGLYYSFLVRPWYRNVRRALRKEPKVYLWDWSLVDDPGARWENLVASHLLKAVHFWTDHGLGEMKLWFIRDKQKREVDFLVSHDGDPWFIVEAKRSAKAGLSPALAYFQAETGAKHAFQVVRNMPYVDRDCFEVTRPVVVPGLTFLSQLV